MASCSTHDLLNCEILKVKRFASWNGFPRWSVNKLIKTFTAKPSEPRRTNETEDIPAIWIKLPFIGKKGCCLVRNCTRTISRLINKPVKFVTHWQTVNASTFVSAKDPVPKLTRTLLGISFYYMSIEIYSSIWLCVIIVPN